MPNFCQPVISLILLLIASVLILPSMAATNNQISHWTKLTEDTNYSFGKSMHFFNLITRNGSKACLIVFDLNDANLELKPFFSSRPICPSKIVETKNALAAINGGYFNLSDGESASYVIIDGKEQCEPRNNKALIENPSIQPYLETIFNRSELRILIKQGQRSAVICHHNDPVSLGFTLLHSLQAGPMLLPRITDKEEAFYRQNLDGKPFDSIGVYRKAARTAFGITVDGQVMLLCIANKGQEEFSSGITLSELAKTLAELGCDQALNLDGGTSTTMVTEENYRDAGGYHINKVIAGNPEKMVKSGLLILKNN